MYTRQSKFDRPLENKHKMTDKPTAERILKAFADISLTIIKHVTGEDILRRLTPLLGVQEEILQRLGLGAALYRHWPEGAGGGTWRLRRGG